MATYQMIHIAHSPDRNPRAAGSTPGTVGAKGGGIGTCAARRGGIPSSVTFRQPAARRSRARRGWAPEIVNRVTECRYPLLIHNVGICSQTAYSALENFRRTQGLWASPSRRLRPPRAAEHDPLV